MDAFLSGAAAAPECPACCSGRMHSEDEWETHHADFWLSLSDQQQRYVRDLAEIYG